MVSNYRRGGEFCCLRRWWMAGNVRPALQTPDNYKCQAAHRAAGSQQPRTALHCTALQDRGLCSGGAAAAAGSRAAASSRPVAARRHRQGCRRRASNRHLMPVLGRRGGYPPRVAVWSPLAWNVAHAQRYALLLCWAVSARTPRSERRGAWHWGRGRLGRVNAAGEQETRPAHAGVTSAEGRAARR